jgi:hypothetical protein
LEIDAADLLQQIICNIKIRRALTTRHDNVDLKPIIIRASGILPLSVITGDKSYDSEENHVQIRKLLHGFSIIPTRYECIPYCNILYFQRNMDETII